MDTDLPFILTDDPAWLLEIDGLDPDSEPAAEAVLALSNGFIGVRGAIEEGHPASGPASFLAGVFNTPAAPQAPELQQPIPELVVMPDWSRLRIFLGGAELHLGNAELIEMRRSLDMRQGALLRVWRLRDGAGRVTALRSVRFVSLADRQALGQFLQITPENYAGELCVEAILDGRVSNANATRHMELRCASPPAGGAALVAQTAQPGYTVAFAAHSQLAGAAAELRYASFTDGPDRCGERLSWRAAAGQSYTLRRIVAVASSRQGADPAAAAARQLAALRATGLDALLEAHRAAWAARWEQADASIPGDPELQRQARFAIYHLIGAASPADERASIGARALTGERYRGHVFWDTEIFAWPALLYTHPETARALLMYRYHTLAGARAKAADLGYPGALFPWESADTGDEVTPAFMLSGGQPVPVLTGVEEQHIAADVAVAVLQYVAATGDRAFLLQYGAEIVLDVARFWAARAVAEADGRHHIRRVIGPDEYHETVDDNAYTNQLAAWVLRSAGALAASLAADAPEIWAGLAGRLGLGAAELAAWAQVAAGLVDGYDPASGLIEQFAGYHQLAEVDLSDHDTGLATMDAKLGWYAIQRTKVLKQADVVMLLILRWDQYPLAVHTANFDYYEPRTSHDSSLSPSLHALFAARLGRLELAERYLRQAAQIDLDLGRRGLAGAAGGVHIAAMGGIWQALAMGFLGMRPDAAGLRFSPHIPPAWGSLGMAIAWRGSRLRVAADAAGALTVELLSGGPALVAVGEGPWEEVGPGAPLIA